MDQRKSVVIEQNLRPSSLRDTRRLPRAVQTDESETRGRTEYLLLWKSVIESLPSQFDPYSSVQIAHGNDVTELGVEVSIILSF